MQRWRHFLTTTAIALSLLGCALEPEGGSGEWQNADVVARADDLAREGGRLLMAGRYNDALKKINVALQLRIDKSYYHLLNGLAYHMVAKSGDRAAFDLAEQGYNQAIKFDVSNYMAYYFRGRLYIDIGAFDKAQKDLAEALLFRPNDAEILGAFAYASYRSGRPDLAAAALERIERSGGPVAPSTWRNGAVVMAALGEVNRAQVYLSRYCDLAPTPADCRLIGERIKEWAGFYDDSARIVPAQFTTGGSVPEGFYGRYTPTPNGVPNDMAPMAGAGQPATTPTAPGTEEKMVVIDVVLIETEETIGTAKGVNLLTGLNLQFGNSTGVGTAANAYSLVKQSPAGSLPGAAATTTAITRAITVPAVNYTLNILNATTTRNEVLSRPTLIALAGKQSQFFSGVELNAAAVSGVAAAGGTSIGGQSISIDKDIGVKLTVLPTVLPDGRLKMAVSADRTFIEPPNPNVTFTLKIETSKDSVSANVVMRYGETLILGGLSEKEAQYSREGVPGLQDTPILQYLFSNETKTDYQKSVLILMTPRPTQYVYQPENARKEYEKSLSEDERPLANLQARYADWFKPYPNWASVFHHLQENSLYREFRTGDVDLESWSDMRTMHDRLQQILEFLHY